MPLHSVQTTYTVVSCLAPNIEVCVHALTFLAAQSIECSSRTHPASAVISGSKTSNTAAAQSTLLFPISSLTFHLRRRMFPVPVCLSSRIMCWRSKQRKQSKQQAQADKQSDDDNQRVLSEKIDLKIWKPDPGNWKEAQNGCDSSIEGCNTHGLDCFCAASPSISRS